MQYEHVHVHIYISIYTCISTIATSTLTSTLTWNLNLILNLNHIHIHTTVMRAANIHASEDLPSVPLTRLLGHEAGPIRAVQFSHDGKYCLSAGHDRTVRLFNPLRIDPAYASNAAPATRNANANVPQTETETGGKDMTDIPPALPIQTYTDGHTHPISAIAMDASSTTLLSASHHSLIVTDVLTRKLQRRFQGHTGVINTVACSKDASIYVSGSYDGTVRIWDGRSRDRNPIQVLDDAKDSVSNVNILQDSSGSGGWDGGGCEIVTASIDGCIRSYDLRRGLVHVDDLNGAGAHKEQAVSLTSVSCTSDAKLMAIHCLHGSIPLMERSSGTILTTCFGGHSSGRYSLECHITADDRYVATGSEDGAVVFYDLDSGEVVQTLEGHTRATCSIACHPKPKQSSMILTGSYDGSAIVWGNRHTTAYQ
jgi:mitogen-activated protein kinase organizer 1